MNMITSYYYSIPKAGLGHNDHIAISKKYDPQLVLVADNGSFETRAHLKNAEAFGTDSPIPVLWPSKHLKEVKMFCSFSNLDDPAVKKIQDLENEIGKTLISFSCRDVKVADVDAATLSKIQDLEKKLSISLIALDT